MATFTASLLGSTDDPQRAIERVQRRLPDGFKATGTVTASTLSRYLVEVEIEDLGGDRRDAWFWLTSYGMSPSFTTGQEVEA